MGAVLLAVWDAHSSCIGAHGTAILCAPPLCFCYLVTIITYYLGYCKQKSDNFNLHECRRGGKSLRRRLCTLRAVCGLVSMVQIRSYVHPLCDIWATPRRRNFLLRSYPHKPNRARRAQSAHAPNCGYVPNRGSGGRAAEYVASGRRPLCGVKDAAKRLPVRFIRTGGEMNFHKCGWNCCIFCGNNSTLWILPPFGRFCVRQGPLLGGIAGHIKIAWDGTPSQAIFSAAIHRCPIHKREHVLGYQNLKVRHF